MLLLLQCHRSSEIEMSVLPENSFMFGRLEDLVVGLIDAGTERNI
jgi:hypothetical protein